MDGAEHGRLTRITMFVAVFVVAIMLGPGLLLGTQHLSPAGNASAVTTDRVLRIGWPDFYSNIRTLNPHTMTMGQEYMLIVPCYSNLLTYDENSNPIGDLATKWTVSPDGTIYHFWIVHTASFYDKNNPGVQQPLTVNDVMFSFWLAQNNSVSIDNYYFPQLPGTSGKLIASMTKYNNYEMDFHLRAAFSPFMSALTGVPIVPEYIWAGKPVGWANFAKGGNPIAPCIGSGPYYYGYDDIATIGSIGQSLNIMNPTWFGTTEYGWQPHVYQYTVKSETPATGITDFEAGNLDVLISPTPTQFTSYSGSGTKFSSSQGFVLDMCINQLSLADRTTYSVGGPGDSNSQILLDPTVKFALKACVNKSAVVDFSLLGGGSPADSLIPTSMAYYYDYGSNPTKDTKLIPDGGNIAAARSALMAAGWHYRTDGTDLLGAPDQNTYAPLAKVGGTEVLSFRYAYPDWYDFILDEGTRIQGWALAAGIVLTGGPASSSAMNGYWSSANYDVYLWDWWFAPTNDPSLDIMSVMTSMEIGKSSDVNDDNATYDAMYYASLTATSFAQRKAILDDMQRWAYENSGYWPIAYRDNLYIVQSVGPEYWTNWGNWVTNYGLCPDANFPWLYCRLTSAAPGGNPAPNIDSFSTYYDAVAGTNDTSFTGHVNDLNTLSYRWNWGDGTSTGWLTSPSYNHQYATDGYYSAHFMVKETNGADGFISFATATVKVIDISNALPVIQAFSPSPSNPTAGELVYFNGSATDANPGDTLSYSWNFGDNTTASGQYVTHRFPAAAIYSVTLSVDDGHYGSAPRPATRTQSVQVVANSPPIISVGDYPNVVKGQATTFSCTASDPNIRDVLKFTWVWGDGGVSVTTTLSTRHTYKFVGDYTLTVWADDGTGITSPPHNVSDTGLVHVVNSGVNHAPTILDYTVSNANPWTGQAVTFWATPIDLDGDICDVTFTFGDGYTSGVITQSAPNATVSATHAYLTANDWFPSVTFTDTTAAPVTRASTTMSPSWWVTSHGGYFVLHLSAGWNMVSLPLVGFGYKASTLGLLTDDIVTGWNGVTYDQTYIVGHSPARYDFALAQSTGYWVYAGGARDLSIFGNVSTGTQTKTVTVPAGGGWYIIGFSGLNATRLASQIKTMYTGGTVTTVAWYNTTSGAYLTYIGTVRTDFMLSPGWGIWIYVTASGTLSYTP